MMLLKRKHMSYQMKFIEDCLATITLIFFLSAAQLYYSEKQRGTILGVQELFKTTTSRLLNSTSSFFLTTGRTLAELEGKKSTSVPVQTYTSSPNSTIQDNKASTAHSSFIDSSSKKEATTLPILTKSSLHAHLPFKTHKKEMVTLHKQIDFIRNTVATDTLLSLSEKNTLQELIKECDTKVDHLSQFIKKSLIEFELPEQRDNKHSLKLYESYVNKKIAAIAENVLQLTLLFYTTMTGKEYTESSYTTTTEIFKALKDINAKVRPFIV